MTGLSKGMLARQAAQQSQLMLRRLSQRTASASCAPARLAALCAAQLKQMPLRARQCSTWDGALVANAAGLLPVPCKQGQRLMLVVIDFRNNVASASRYSPFMDKQGESHLHCRVD